MGEADPGAAAGVQPLGHARHARPTPSSLAAALAEGTAATWKLSGTKIVDGIKCAAITDPAKNEQHFTETIDVSDRTGLPVTVRYVFPHDRTLAAGFGHWFKHLRGHPGRPRSWPARPWHHGLFEGNDGFRPATSVFKLRRECLDHVLDPRRAASPQRAGRVRPALQRPPSAPELAAGAPAAPARQRRISQP